MIPTRIGSRVNALRSVAGLVFVSLAFVVAGASRSTADGTAAVPAPSVKLPARATCPVDGKSFAPSVQSPNILVNESTRYFCSAGCRDRFLSWPEKYLRTETIYCLVQPSVKSHIDLPRRVELNNGLYYLCCEPCTQWMRDKPWLYVSELKDPVSGQYFQLAEGAPRSVFKGQIYLFASPETKSKFDAAPEKYTLVFHR